MRPRTDTDDKTINPAQRVQVWFLCLAVIVGIFGIRLFYLQVIRHDYYRKAALSSQLKEYLVPAERGIIEAKDGDQITPIVLNEKKYTLFVDPKYITESEKAAFKIQKEIGGDASAYEKQMKLDTRYAILAKKLDKSQKEKIDNVIDLL